jgi:alkylation response protein AidB-like acyl-CoA dehydrogenase
MNDGAGSVLDVTRDLFPLISEAAAQPGPVARETVDRMHRAGLFGTMVPRDCGGLELPLLDSLDVFAEVSRADGSAGWVLMAGAATIAFFGAWAGDQTIDDLFADGVPLAAGQFAPNGVALPVDAGYRLTGEYQFGSGINHADWVGAGVMTQPDDGSDPAYLLAIMPASNADLKGNWDVLGLEATASWDYGIHEVTVPASATFDFFAPVRRRGGPTYDLGVMVLTALGHAGFAIGVTRRALDELAALASTKTRMGAGSSLAESESFQLALARLESRAASAAAWTRQTFVEAERGALAGEIDPAACTRARQATVHVTQEGADIVREAYLLAGTSALRDGPLQRCFRDLHAGSQHFFAGDFTTLEMARDVLAAASGPVG